MEKETWKPGNMLYPLPAVMVSAADKKGGAEYHHGCMDRNHLYQPGELYISVRPERYSYHMIKETGEFVVNLTTESLAVRRTGVV